MCGTTVINARSLSPKFTLTISAGRVLPAAPKSISQTSPRAGNGIFVIEVFEKRAGSRSDFIVRERTGVEGQRAAKHFLRKRKGPLFVRRQGFECFEQCGRLGAHGHILTGLLNRKWCVTQRRRKPERLSFKLFKRPKNLLKTWRPTSRNSYDAELDRSFGLW